MEYECIQEYLLQASVEAASWQTQQYEIYNWNCLDDLNLEICKTAEAMFQLLNGLTVLN